MVNSRISSHCQTNLLHEYSCEILGHAINYKLYSIDFDVAVKYIICIDYKGEFETAFLGSDALRAEKIYNFICRNEVTPCTLCGIIDDFLR